MFALLTLFALAVMMLAGAAVLGFVFVVAKSVLKLALFPLLIGVVLFKVALVLFLLPLLVTFIVTMLAIALAFALPVLVLFGIVWGGVMVLA